MSIDDGHSLEGKTIRRPRQKQPQETNKTLHISSYVHTMLKGIRELTRQSGQKDLKYLDYLLAVAEDEASNLASKPYH